MPNNTAGWRKKIHAKAKDAPLPREIPPLQIEPPPGKADKPGSNDAATVDDPADRRRHHGWRKTIQASRPSTPVSATLTVTPAIEDIADNRSERSETPGPRRDSKPKTGRYASLFTSLKDVPKGPDFAEPWSVEAEPVFAPYIDPLNAIQCVRSHIVNNSTKPIPTEHSNSLLCVFEDYRKMRDAKELLGTQLQDLRQDMKRAKEAWADEEHQYHAEIRRLELLMAHGAIGVAGVLQARQSSVVDRKRKNRRPNSVEKRHSMYAFTPGQLDKEIRLKSQRGTLVFERKFETRLTNLVFLERPTSPSETMAALSRQFERTASVEVRVGTLSSEDGKMTLSRKVQSELILTKLGRTEPSQSVADSATSGFSGGSGDPLPDEITTSSVMTDTTIECEAFAALRELGALVARRRGVNVDVFLSGLIQLVSDARVHSFDTDVVEESPLQPKLVNTDSSSKLPCADDNTTPTRALRRFQSQPLLSSTRQHRRNFSFDPGQDQLQALQEELTPAAAKRSYVGLAISETSAFGDMREPARSPLGVLKSSSQVSVSSQDSSKLSKIPSPALPCGRVRRETSASSLQSMFTRLTDERSDSRTSNLTAFRESSAGNLRTGSSSRSSSFQNLRTAEVSPSLTAQTSSVGTRNSVVALAVARATEQANLTTTREAGSPGKNTVGSSLRRHAITDASQYGINSPSSQKRGLTSARTPSICDGSQRE